MLPAERSDVRQQCVVDLSASLSHRGERAIEIDGVPQHDCCGEEGQARCSVLLPLSTPVSNTSKAMEADRACERVSALSLVEFDGRIPPQLRVFEPVERKERALDSPDFS